jgi:hypothetical protein
MWLSMQRKNKFSKTQHNLLLILLVFRIHLVTRSFWKKLLSAKVSKKDGYEFTIDMISLEYFFQEFAGKKKNKIKIL